MKSYKERKLNLFLTGWQWISLPITLLLYQGSKPLQHDPLSASPLMQEIAATCGIAVQELPAVLFKNTISSVVYCLLISAWTVARNNYYLVRAAEKEVLEDMCQNWALLHNHIPTELVPLFKSAVRLKLTNLDPFGSRARKIIDEIKQRIEQRQLA